MRARWLVLLAGSAGSLQHGAPRRASPPARAARGRCKTPTRRAPLTRLYNAQSSHPSWITAVDVEQDVYNTAVQAEKPPWQFTKSHAEATIGREAFCDVSQEKTSRVRCVAQSQHHVAWDRTPQRVLVLAKRHADDEELDVAYRIARHLHEACGVDVLLADPLYEQIGKRLPAVELWQGEHVSRSPDFVATLGGDGLLLYANTLFQATPPPPVVAFGAGSLGFLAPFDVDDDDIGSTVEETLDEAVSLGEGELEPWPVSLRMRLRCRVVDGASGKVVGGHEALNEVALDRGNSPFLSAVECFCNDEHLTTAQADGLIVATPTGSTAYSLSAGGPMVHPSVNAMVFTPICAHSLSFRPIVFPDSCTLRFDVDPDARADAWVTFDGRSRVCLKRGDSLIVTASPHPLPTVLRLGNTADWFGGLRTHFNFNVRRRQQKIAEQFLNG